MKKILYPALILSALFVASCKNKDVPQRTVITGKIENLSVYPDSKEFTLTVKDITSDSVRYTGTIQKDGTFKIAFDQYIAQDVSLNPVVRTFIAHPGDSIHVDINYKDMGNVVFSGDGEKTNNDLFHYLSENYSVYDDGERTGAASNSFFKNNDIKSHIDLNNESKNTMMQKREEFITKYNPNDEVKAWTKNQININYYGSILNFAMAVARKSEKPEFDFTKVKGLEHINEDLDEIYNKSTLNTGAYKLTYMFFPLMNVHDTSQISSKIINGKNNPILKQMLLGTIFHRLIKSGEAETYHRDKGFFEKHINEPFLKQPIAKYYVAVKRNFEHPEILSDALLANVYKTPVKGLIDSIRKENAGKVILIDIWATWCAPCVREMPYSKKLMEKYKGKDVRFVFICTGVNKVLWTDHIKELKSGQHYFLDQEQTKQLRKAFNVEGIPHKIMLNKKGDIVENGNVLGTYDPMTAKKIDRLLASN